MFRVVLSVFALPLLLLQHGDSVDAFVSQRRVALLPRQQEQRQVGQTLASSTATAGTDQDARPRQVKELGLLTFDLDDTLYPISTVVASANSTFLLLFSPSKYLRSSERYLFGDPKASHLHSSLHIC